ncbi:MAG: hypothetical protein ABIB71_03670 [Candidatus Woesearchaeota archaeon]
MATISLNRTEQDIFSGYSKLETPDERKENKVEGSLFFEGFEELVRQYKEILSTEEWSNVPKLLGETRMILEPEEINSFLQAIIKYENHENYSKNTGYFITRLIQNSHNTGNNKFTLNTIELSKDIHNLASDFNGRKDKLLEIIVDGSVGKYCCAWAKNIGQLYIGGNAGKCCVIGAENSTFKTPNKETLQLLKKNVEKDKNNRIYFIHPNNQEEEIK